VTAETAPRQDPRPLLAGRSPRIVAGSAKQTRDRYARTVERAPVPVELIGRVRSIGERVQFEGKLARVGAFGKLTPRDRDPGLPFELVTPGTAGHDDCIAHRARPTVKLSRGCGEEAAAGKNFALEVANVSLDQCTQTVEPGLDLDRRLDNLTPKHSIRGLERGELELLLGSKVSEEAALAHAQIGRQAADRQTFEALERGETHCSTEDGVAGAVAGGGGRAHGASLARTFGRVILNERSAADSQGGRMLVRRLTWAGLEIRAPGTTLVIDLLGGVPELSQYAGEPTEDLLAPCGQPGTVTAAAVTHPHSDHLDIEALRGALADGAPVLCPPEVTETVAGAGLKSRGVELWETVEIGELRLTAVPAVDGFGSTQVSWVLSHGDRRLIHCGDTLWHGYWWEIAQRCGPIDLAFLPVNGAMANFDDLQPPSGIPAVLTPEQAAEAAHLLGAHEASPIHYGTFHKPPLYISLPDPEAAFVAAAVRRGVTTRLMRPGDETELALSEGLSPPRR
jgi:L-ascorbate metabolism protein UlaG (beta-lactamase superfamily)